MTTIQPVERCDGCGTPLPFGSVSIPVEEHVFLRVYCPDCYRRQTQTDPPMRN